MAIFIAPKPPIESSAELLIHVFDKIESNECLYKLLLIEAIAPFARRDLSVAVGYHHDKFRNFACANQRIGGLIGVSRCNPVLICPWRTMQQVERGIMLVLALSNIVRRWKVDVKGLALVPTSYPLSA